MSAVAIVSGLDLILQLIGRLSAASALVNNARAEGRDVTSAELAQFKMQGQEALVLLDASIARAQAEGR